MEIQGICVEAILSEIRAGGGVEVTHRPSGVPLNDGLVQYAVGLACLCEYIFRRAGH